MDILGRRYYEMYKYKKCTDLTIELKISEDEGVYVYFDVHKFILASRSPVFEAMISAGTEKLEKDGISLECENTPEFEDFLEFIYTSKIEKYSQERLSNILFLCDKYHISDFYTFAINNMPKTRKSRNMDLRKQYWEAFTNILAFIWSFKELNKVRKNIFKLILKPIGLSDFDFKYFFQYNNNVEIGILFFKLYELCRFKEFQIILNWCKKITNEKEEEIKIMKLFLPFFYKFKYFSATEIFVNVRPLGLLSESEILEIIRRFSARDMLKIVRPSGLLSDTDILNFVEKKLNSIGTKVETSLDCTGCKTTEKIPCPKCKKYYLTYLRTDCEFSSIALQNKKTYEADDSDGY